MLELINIGSNAPEVYVQYPGKRPPSEVYGGAWRSIFDDEGVFFRTPGGSATQFGGGIQGDAIRNLYGTFGAEGLSRDQAGSSSATGVLKVGPRAHRAYGGASYSGSVTIVLDASLGVPTADENRPRNRTIRVWEKI